MSSPSPYPAASGLCQPPEGVWLWHFSSTVILRRKRLGSTAIGYLIMTMDQAETCPLLLESYREIGRPWALLWKLVLVLLLRFENHIMLKSFFSWAWELLLVARRESSSATFWLDYLRLFPFLQLKSAGTFLHISMVPFYFQYKVLGAKTSAKTELLVRSGVHFLML